MIVPGLVSVTFRQKSIGEICEICRAAGLSAVEWGGDVHVPPENIAAAGEARRLSREYGLEICSYGSYWCAGDGRDAFLRNLEAAEELGAPVIRVWWGRTGSAETAESVRREWMEEMRVACREAKKVELQVAPEFHPGTLTDTPGSLERLLRETADIPNLRYYWQPRWDWPEETRLETLDELLPRLARMHVFTWRHGPQVERLPLAEGADFWKKVLQKAPDTYALMEFVREDDQRALMEDAAALRRWIGEEVWNLPTC